MAKKEVPTGMKVISVLYWIGAIVSIIAGILSLVGAGVSATLFGNLGALGAGILIIIAIVMIALGILGIFIAIGLWRGRNWARILAGILSILGMLNSLFAVIGGDFAGIIYLIIYGVIVWYLLLNKNVKAATK